MTSQAGGAGDLAGLLEEAAAAIAAAGDQEAVRQAAARYLGRKGALTARMAGLRDLAPDRRRALGQEINRVKTAIEAAAASRAAALLHASLSRDLSRAVDVSLPGRRAPRGHLHPVTRAMRDVAAILGELGFEIAEGPQVETDFHNFEALAIPRDHPARDMQDTFYVDGGDLLLRTHTSPVQIRTMIARPPPVRIIAPGVVYRRDDDPTHSPMFHQVEGLCVDREVSLGDLKGTLLHLAHRFFGPDIGIRLRPSYFPFTEPSAELDIACVFCRGRGCRTCKETGWLEIGGCGMVDPAVFAAVASAGGRGYGPDEVAGFAFGMGVDRMAMLRHRIDDIRLLFSGDMRFLEQF